MVVSSCWQSAMTIWAVSAVSVVLMGQMCTWWISTTPGGDKDDGGDDESNDGVDDCPAGVGDDDAGDHHAGGDEGVGEHVEEGSACVDVVLVSREHPGGEAVDGDGCCGSPSDKEAVDRCRVREFVDAFHHNAAHGHEEDDGVEQRDEH